MNGTSAATRYFEFLRQAREQGSQTDRILWVIASIRDEVKQGQVGPALEHLDSLKGLIADARTLIDDLEVPHKETVELMMLRKRVLELTQENALLRGDEATAADCEKLVQRMDDFFSASIADLDPER